jgi:hypothetical protein
MWCKLLEVNTEWRSLSVTVGPHVSFLQLSIILGRAIAQAVSRWLPTAEAWIRARVQQVGFMVDKVALGMGFSEYFGFPRPSSFHQILHHHKHPGQVQ